MHLKTLFSPTLLVMLERKKPRVQAIKCPFDEFTIYFLAVSGRN